MSRLWLAGDIAVESSQPQNVFRGAVLHRLRWSGAHGSAQTSFPCACGFPTANVTGTSTREVVEHIAGCRKNGGPTVRHNMVKMISCGLLAKAGHSITVEQTIGKDTDGKDLIIDIVSVPPNGPKLYLDWTIANSRGRSLASKGLEGIFDAKDQAKRKKYEALATAQGAEYKTLACDVFGTFSKETRAFLNQLASDIKLRHPDVQARDSLTAAAAVFRPISRAIAYGNGLCLIRSGHLRRLGFNPSAVPQIFAPRDQARLPDAALINRDDDNIRSGAFEPYDEDGEMYNLPGFDIDESAQIGADSQPVGTPVVSGAVPPSPL